MQNCLFCSLDSESIVDQTACMLAFRDRFPVTDGHTLIVPKSHKIDFFELNEQETSEAFELARRVRESLQSSDPTITGFNIGMNCGESAGQTIFHCHMHLIPRRAGDIANPKGGVRGVIPAKQQY